MNRMAMMQDFVMGANAGGAWLCQMMMSVKDGGRKMKDRERYIK